jgi:predicted metal-dependent peptidase
MQEDNIQEQIEKKVISNEQKKKNLESTLYSFNRKYPFFGAFLSEISIEHTESIPTAGLMYDKKTNEFKTLINPVFFDSLDPSVRVAVLYHEVLHFTHGHLLRFESTDTETENLDAEGKVKLLNEKGLQNIAADMAINQYIPELPDWAVRPEKFKDNKGAPFPPFLTYERYYELLKKHKDNKHNKDLFKEQKVRLVDEHNWEQMSEEEKARMLGKAKEVIQRTIEKTSHEYSNAKDQVKGLIEKIDTYVKKLNYRQLLRLAIKQTVSKTDRESTWTKPNRRYGVYAPGTRTAKVPMLNIYVDTSGSISHKEVNQFLTVIKGFLKVGSSVANICLWHDNLYYNGKIKQSTQIEDLPVESGGTDVTDVIEHINKNKPNLSIILTDGQFSTGGNVNSGNPVIWVISDEYGMQHPYKNTGKTVLLNGVL